VAAGHPSDVHAQSAFVAELATSLERFTAASTSLLASRALLQRSDTKFVASPRAIAGIVDKLSTAFAVVPVGTDQIASYENGYLDTPEKLCFHDHRRERRIRHKIRIRRYRDRQLAFLEIKTRRNGLHTDKARLQIAYDTSELDDLMVGFLAERCSFARSIIPTVAIDYQRIMLVGIATNERVTIDFGLAIDGDATSALGAIAIIEVKQPSRAATPVIQTLRQAGLRPCSLSKYVTALAPRPELRGNRLRPVLRMVERIAHS
jgi:VTC domain